MDADVADVDQHCVKLWQCLCDIEDKPHEFDLAVLLLTGRRLMVERSRVEQAGIKTCSKEA